MARKIYHIKFKTRTAVGLFLYELRMWGVKGTRYIVNELTVSTKDANVVDVATESFAASEYAITTKARVASTN